MIAPLLAAALLMMGAPEPEIIAGQLSTPHVTVHFTDRARGSAPVVLPQIEATRDTFQRLLGRSWPRPIAVRLGVGREELEALALPGSTPPRWAVALAYPEHDLMLLDALSLSEPSNASTIRHELAHLALGQLGAFPRWFHEGLAVLLSGEQLDLGHYAAMYRGVRGNRLSSFEVLAEGWPEHRSESEIAYAQSSSFLSYLIERHGPAAFDELFRHVRAGAPFEIAFARAFHASIGLEERDWRQTLERRYGTVPVAVALSLMWGAAALLCVAAFARRRALKEQNLQRMDAESAAEGEWLEPLPEEAPPPPGTAEPGDGPPRVLH